MKTYLRAFILILFVLLFASCTQKILATGNITAVRSAGLITPLQRVPLQGSVSSNSDDTLSVTWESSIQGLIGKGNPTANYLIPGAHTISLIANDTVLDTTDITVSDYLFHLGKTLYHPQYMTTGLQPLPTGGYAPFAVSVPLYHEDGKDFVSSVEVSSSEVTPNARIGSGLGGLGNVLGYGEGGYYSLEEFQTVRDNAKLAYDHKYKEKFDFEHEDFPIEPGKKAPKLPEFVSALAGSSSRRSPSADFFAEPSQDVGSTRTFKVYSSSAQNNYRTITAVHYHEGSYFDLWVDVDDYNGAPGASAELNEIVSTSETLIMPRLAGAPGGDSIVGGHYDLDNSGGFSVIVTGIINDDGRAIGFFNPVDFFDSSQTNFEMSNEKDIVYLAFPDESNSNYTVDSLTATLGHEYVHLALFSQKTYQPLVDGTTSTILIEKSFLNEGIAHLSESLLGYGESGGNLLFVKSYILWPEYFSLSGKNTINGGEDSAERRGAMLALLWWLFDQEGGATWNENGTLTDGGGLAFLKRMVSSHNTGWDNLVQASHTYSDVTSVLTSWAADYMQIQYNQEELAPEVLRDPKTAEIITASPFVGEFVYGGFPRRLDSVSTVDMSDSIEAYPYTVIWGNPFSVGAGGGSATLSVGNNGNMTYGFAMVE